MSPSIREQMGAIFANRRPSPDRPITLKEREEAFQKARRTTADRMLDKIVAAARAKAEPERSSASYVEQNWTAVKVVERSKTTEDIQDAIAHHTLFH